MRTMRTIVLEPSTNTHSMTDVVNVVNVDSTTLLTETSKSSIVVHGEHGTLGMESQFVVKYNQKEVNPITGMLQNAFD